MKIIDADAFEKYAWGNPDIEVDGEPYISPSTVQNFAADHPITIDPPNEPLTLEQLREMDGEPVWFDTIKRWGIVRVCGYGISVLTKSGEYDVTRMKFYRRPPEGEEDT